jgi:cytoplasmic tRNA 2-thiolation protein 2
MQSKALMCWDASNSQALPVFTVGVAFINECAISGEPLDQVDAAVAQMRSIVSGLSPPSKDLHILPIENVFPSDSRKLVDSIADATGREDLLRHLRMLSLQKARCFFYFSVLFCTSFKCS